MLTENDIDRLVFQKLGKYEKTPPSSVWLDIEINLNSITKSRRIERIKRFGLAATVLLAVMAGWRITNSVDTPDNPSGPIASQMTNKLDNKQIPLEINVKSANNSNKPAPIPSDNQVKEINGTPTKMTSLAAFAANNTFIGTDGHKVIPKSGDSVLTEASGQIEQHLRLVEKLASWIENSVEGKTVDPNDKPSTANAAVKNSFDENSPGRSGTDTFKDRETKKKGQWSLKAEYTKGFNSHSRDYGQINDIQTSGSHRYASDNTTTNSFSAGIITGYKPGKRVTVKSGIVYNKISQSSQDVNKLVINFTNIADPRIAERTSLKQTFEYIEIPLRVTCKLNDSKFGISVTGGLSSHILVGNKAVLLANRDQLDMGKTSNIRAVQYSGELGMELGYEINNRLTICVEPRFKHYINSLSTTNSAGINPNQFEIATGLQYNFN